MSKSLIFAHFLFFGVRCEWFAHFAQIKWAIWANCSFCSPKMSDHERFAQVAQRKWAIVSESLISLTKNEQMSESFIFLSKLLIRSYLDKKRAICLEIKWANSQPCLYPTICCPEAKCLGVSEYNLIDLMNFSYYETDFRSESVRRKISPLHYTEQSTEVWGRKAYQSIRCSPTSCEPSNKD